MGYGKQLAFIHSEMGAIVRFRTKKVMCSDSALTRITMTVVLRTDSWKAVIEEGRPVG